MCPNDCYKELEWAKQASEAAIVKGDSFELCVLFAVFFLSLIFLWAGLDGQ